MNKTLKCLTAALLLSSIVLSGCTGTETKETESAPTPATAAPTEETAPETEAPVVSPISLVTPADGENNIVLASEPIIKHMNSRYSQIQSVNFGYAKEELCTPPPVTFSWTDENASEGKEYTLTISENEDLSSPAVYTVKEMTLDVYNLKIGTEYYWSVSSADDTSAVFTFKTDSGYPRFIKADNISNFRDIGGYQTDDGRYIKQGLAYRSGQLEDANDYGRDVVVNQLGIKTDLDLRGAPAVSPINGLDKISISLSWYDGIFKPENYQNVKKAIGVFADEANYPILFHCSLGRDRTGTTAFILLALCGVDEKVILRDYFTSFYSLQGNFSEFELNGAIANTNALLAGFDTYAESPTDTLQQKVENYLRGIGVTQAEIDSIRSILIA